MKRLVVALLLLASPACAAPKVCVPPSQLDACQAQLQTCQSTSATCTSNLQSTQGQLSTCQSALATCQLGAQPVLQPAINLGAAIGTSVTTTLTVPTDPGGIWIVNETSPAGVDYAMGTWTRQSTTPGVYTITFTTEVGQTGIARLAYRVTSGGQVLEFPIIVTVTP